MCRALILKVSIIFLIFTSSAEISLACSYGPPYSTVCENYTLADYVIVGKIQSVVPGRGDQRVSVKIEKTYKGQKLNQIVLNQPQSTCDPDFSEDVGETMLIYIVRNNQTKKFKAIAPGTGGRADRKTDELRWLNDLPMSLKRTRLSGTVELYKASPFEFLNYIVGTKVRVFNDKSSFEVLTDKYGIYEIWDIPNGKYQIKPTIPPNLELRVDVERGLIDFDTLQKKNPDTRDVLVEIQSKGCGGIDFILRYKNETQK